MSKLTRKLALCAGIGLATCAGLSYVPPAAAQVSVGLGISVGTPPPPPRAESMPPPRRGWVWSPGYWRWSPRWHRHVWMRGHWVRARPGFRYMPPAWVRGPRGYWHFHPGYWAR